MRSVWKNPGFLAALILVLGAPLLGVLAVQERISDLGAGKALAAGRVAWVAEGKLWVKDLPDGKARQLAAGEDISRPTWSPTSRWLLFRRGEDLWLVGVGRGEARCMAQGVDEFAWSPATDVFAFTAGGELCAGEPAKDGLRTLVKWEPGVDIGRIAWSPDGKWVALERQKIEPGVPGYAGIWKVDATSGAVKRVYTSRLHFDRESGVVGEVPRLAGWSPDGEQILFWLGPLSASLEADGLPFYTVNAAGGEAVRCADVLVGERGLEPVNDVILVRPGSFITSHHFNQMAVIVGGGRETWTNKRLGILYLQTNKLGFVSPESQAVVDAAFSPNSKLLVYSAGPVLEDAGGDEAAVRRALAGRKLWAVGTDGGKPRRLTNDPAYRDEWPLFTTDGQQILFVRLDAEDRASLWLVRPDGSGLERVVEEIGPLTEEFAFGYYGAVAWDELFAYWPGVADAALINAAKGTPEAKKLLARYPWAQVLVDRSGKLAVDFRVDKLESGDEPGPYLRLRVFIDPATNTSADRFLDLNGRVIRTEILRHLDEETVFGTKVSYVSRPGGRARSGGKSAFYT
ncbi:WD40 domain protein beta Propeller [Candidatus Desulforudis audaxviator MP104C]|uniref:WD40 domain protein beta Propeller n=1 Tax=Desulforudis audaxviator (strain MP104C) TaxID=477974 RepID=B1I2S2_DESAP|nr:DPP IV N-terminal domain-containing protein [Candidatus Desulforudis audaxviator]ACA59261.1 WD40 domain protein beta Propeller [Candidatus Desulforudis audaxviator MP104C]